MIAKRYRETGFSKSGRRDGLREPAPTCQRYTPAHQLVSRPATSGRPRALQLLAPSLEAKDLSRERERVRAPGRARWDGARRLRALADRAGFLANPAALVAQGHGLERT